MISASAVKYDAQLFVSGWDSLLPHSCDCLLFSCQAMKNCAKLEVMNELHLRIASHKAL